MKSVDQWLDGLILLHNFEEQVRPNDVWTCVACRRGSRNLC